MLVMVVKGFDALLEDFFDLVRVIVIHRSGPQRITDQGDRRLVRLNFWILPEDRRFFRVFDVLFQSDRVLPGDANERKQQTE